MKRTARQSLWDVFHGGRYGAGTVFRLTPPAKLGTLWSETTLYSFTGGADGLYTTHGVIMDGSGTLFGTTEYGGTPSIFCGSGCGTVFALTPPKNGGAWIETVVHAFSGLDGALPECDLISDAAGNMYGTTEVGQQIDSAGTVFQLTRPAKPGDSWTERVLAQFLNHGPAPGAPLAGVVFGHDGALYGTTSGGGYRERGTAFRLAPPVQNGKPWTQSVLHSFASSPTDGSFPEAPLAIGYDGAFYGTTPYGGSGKCSTNNSILGCGTAFRVAP